MRIPLVHRTLWSLGLAVAAVSGPLRAAESAAPQFQHADRVCFVGDSITAGGIYSTYLKIFYATRYPDREIAFSNAGKSGGSAVDALNRLAWDILVHRPTAATVSFGMNDMSRLHLGISGTPEALEESIQERMKSVEANYKKLLDALTGTNVKLTLIGPSPYDDTLQVETKIERSNVAMARWTTRIGEIAKQHGAGFVDMGAALNPVNQRLQAVDPAASIVGKDRVHPGPAGHLLMAMAILKAQNVDPEVSRIRVDARTGKPGPLTNCTVEAVRTGAQGVEFLCRENALPFVFPQRGGMQGAAFWGIAEKAAAQIQAAGGPELIPFQSELNRETLHVTGLSAGRYNVRIDEQFIGEYGAEELAAGVNLAENPKTPQHAQALALAKSLEAVRALDGSFFRVVAHVRGTFIEPAKVDITDEAAVEQCLREAIAKLPADNFGRGMAERYLKSVPGQAAGKLEELEKLLAQIREQRVLKPHRFSVSRKSDG
jgi:lysophospholipase L1-like esterase